MTPQLKPGCLAEVVRDDDFKENQGRIVTVQQPDTQRGSLVWWVAAPALVWGWRVKRGGISFIGLVDRELVDRRFYNPVCLRPIADPDSYTQRDHVVEMTREKCDAALDKLGLVV